MGMKIVWVDVCFAINFCADYLICLLAARLCAAPLRRGRFVLAALLGALWAVAAAAAPETLFVSPAGKLLCGAAMCALAYGGRPDFSRLCAAFFALSAALGGTVWAISLANGGAPRLSPVLLGGSFALFYLLFSLLLRGSAAAAGREVLAVELQFLGRRAAFRALRDTGNTLCDPLSGARVMVVSPAALRDVFGQSEAIFRLGDPLEILRCADGVDTLRGKLRLIPYSTVGAKGFLPAFRPERLCVGGREERDLLVALSPSASGDGFEAIL